MKIEAQINQLSKLTQLIKGLIIFGTQIFLILKPMV